MNTGFDVTCPELEKIYKKIFYKYRKQTLSGEKQVQDEICVI